VRLFNFGETTRHSIHVRRKDQSQTFFRIRKPAERVLRLLGQDHSRGRKLRPEGNRPSASYPIILSGNLEGFQIQFLSCRAYLHLRNTRGHGRNFPKVQSQNEHR
jgi:hypothetical protein